MKIRQNNKLATYLAVTAGVGCASNIASGAVTFYGINSANDTNPNPSGINLGTHDATGYLVVDSTSSPSSLFSVTPFPSLYTFTRGNDLYMIGNTNALGIYGRDMFLLEGMAGSENYANISFNGPDDIFEAVGQFFFDGEGGGFLIALAFAEGTTLADGITPLTSANAPTDLSTLTNTGTETLSISAGAAAIDAVPEPSGLALLALGSIGLAVRRNRKQAA